MNEKHMYDSIASIFSKHLNDPDYKTGLAHGLFSSYLYLSEIYSSDMANKILEYFIGVYGNNINFDKFNELKGEYCFWKNTNFQIEDLKPLSFKND